MPRPSKRFWRLSSLAAIAAFALALTLLGLIGTDRHRLLATDWTFHFQQGAVVIQTGFPSAVIRVNSEQFLGLYWWTGWNCQQAWISIGSAMAYIYVIPLWMPLLLLALAGGGIWRFTRPRFPSWACPDCGYDLRATKGGCPECGRGIAKPSAFLRLALARLRATLPPCPAPARPLAPSACSLPHRA